MIYLDRPFKVGEFIKSPDRNIEGYCREYWLEVNCGSVHFQKTYYISQIQLLRILFVENATRMTNRTN